jgi:hypothetical protein
MRIESFVLATHFWVIKGCDQVNNRTTDATIIRCIFLELNQSEHVSGIIMPIIRRTKTRLVKTSCEDAWLCWL